MKRLSVLCYFLLFGFQLGLGQAIQHASQASDEQNYLIRDSLNIASKYFKHYRFALKFGVGLDFESKKDNAVHGVSTFTFVSNPESLRHAFYHLVSFQKRRKTGDIHEISLNEISRFNNPSVVIGTAPLHSLKLFNINIQYSYFVDFMRKEPNAQLAAMLGFAMASYHNHLRILPSQTAVEPSKYSIYGLRPKIIPRIAWYPKFRMFLDLSLPITLLDLRYHHFRYGDPSVGVDFQSTSGTKVSFPSANFVAIALTAGFKF